MKENIQCTFVLLATVTVFVGLSGYAHAGGKRTITDRVLERVTPGADQNTRQLQKDAVMAVVDPRPSKQQENVNRLSDSIRKSGSDSSNNTGSSYSSSVNYTPPSGYTSFDSNSYSDLETLAWEACKHDYNSHVSQTNGPFENKSQSAQEERCGKYWTYNLKRTPVGGTIKFSPTVRFLRLSENRYIIEVN